MRTSIVFEWTQYWRFTRRIDHAVQAHDLINVGSRPKSFLIEREGCPHALLVQSRGEKSAQPLDPLRLPANQMAQARRRTGHDVEQRLGHEYGPWPLLVRSANRIESSFPQQVIFGKPTGCDLPVVHHWRPEKARFRQRDVNIEGLDFVT